MKWTDLLHLYPKNVAVQSATTSELFFALLETAHENYMTNLRGQTERDVRDCLEALLRNDLQYLEDKIK